MQWFKIPAKTYFEPNAIKYLRDMYGIERAVIVCDKVMEQLGIVGPFEGSKPRQVLITKQQWQEMQLMNGAAPTERFQTEMEFGTDSDMDAE